MQEGGRGQENRSGRTATLPPAEMLPGWSRAAGRSSGMTGTKVLGDHALTTGRHEATPRRRAGLVREMLGPRERGTCPTAPPWRRLPGSLRRIVPGQLIPCDLHKRVQYWSRPQGPDLHVYGTAFGPLSAPQVQRDGPYDGSLTISTRPPGRRCAAIPAPIPRRVTPRQHAAANRAWYSRSA